MVVLMLLLFLWLFSSQVAITLMLRFPSLLVRSWQYFLGNGGGKPSALCTHIDTSTCIDTRIMLPWTTNVMRTILKPYESFGCEWKRKRIGLEIYDTTIRARVMKTVCIHKKVIMITLCISYLLFIGKDGAGVVEAIGAGVRKLQVITNKYTRKIRRDRGKGCNYLDFLVLLRSGMYTTIKTLKRIR